ncbi:MAG: hypothetical protein FJ126_13070 [Deltaproteobacteria bacterium]|nr:hypothetical protein [Deltaproteobacteria bacterium]
MINRREFLQWLGFGLAAGWASEGFLPISPARGANREIHVNLIADAHLKDADDRRAEPRALARAVGEVRRLQSRPDMLLFAGDLAHDGDPKALALGKEILSDLPVPVLMVPGEGDGLEGAPWRRLFGEPWFLRSYSGVNLLGLYTYPCRSPHGLAFELGQPQIAWLAGELARLDPAAPLVVLSHAPLTPVFRPWGQWTRDAERIAPVLARFPHAVYFHGHVHRAGVRGQVSGFRGEGSGGNRLNLFTENRKPKTENRLSIPATAWPLPSPLQGTPAFLVPGLGPRGCGWAGVSLRSQSWEFLPRIWTA